MFKIIPVIVIVVALGLSACDPDPGNCYTTGDFEKDWVQANVSMPANDYVFMVCSDWVYMLLNNCVEIEGLSWLPTDIEITRYCDRQMRRYADDGDSEGDMGFVIDHSCNFIDNPNFECQVYGTSQTALTDASESAKSYLRTSIMVNPDTKLSLQKMSVYLEGAKVPYSKLIK